jgi:hypothetical protein
VLAVEDVDHGGLVALRAVDVGDGYGLPGEDPVATRGDAGVVGADSLAVQGLRYDDGLLLGGVGIGQHDEDVVVLDLVFFQVAPHAAGHPISLLDLVGEHLRDYGVGGLKEVLKVLGVGARIALQANALAGFEVPGPHVVADVRPLVRVVEVLDQATAPVDPET